VTKTLRALLIGIGSVAVVVLIGWAALRQRPPQQPAPAPVTQPPARPPAASDLTSVPRMPLATAREEIERGTVLVIDVRDADAYVAGHIPGALQIPLMRIDGEIDYLPRDKPILTYCT
jgi:3-mercaptopyruvate sulfurtransferase SseA